MRKKTDFLVLLLIAVIVFGGMHLVREKRLNTDANRVIYLEPAAR